MPDGRNLPTVIHCGYPKTGTSFLQTHVFPQLRPYRYIGIAALLRYKMENLIYGVPAHGNFDKLEQAVRMMKKDSAGQPLFISYEGFTGSLYHGAVNSDNIALTLKHLFPNAVILFTIRNQMTIIDSAYRQYVQQGGTAPFTKFLDLKAPSPVYVDLNMFDYHRLISYYSHIFGRDKIRVMAYEELKSDRRLFLNKLMDDLGVEYTDEREDVLAQNNAVNISLPDRALKLMWLMNHLLSGWANPQAIIPGRWMSSATVRKYLQRRVIKKHQKNRKLKSVNLPERHGMTKKITGMYAEGNRLLSAAYQLDLDRYDYPLND